jgi:hypothetical protein
MHPFSMEKLNVQIAPLQIWSEPYTLMLDTHLINGVMQLKLQQTYIILFYTQLLEYPLMKHGMVPNQEQMT